MLVSMALLLLDLPVIIGERNHGWLQLRIEQSIEAECTLLQALLGWWSGSCYLTETCSALQQHAWNCTSSQCDAACPLTHNVHACHVSGPPTLDPRLPPEQAAFHNPRVAALYLGYMALMLLLCTAFHIAIIFAWTHIKWTAARPLPSLLQFPAAELLLLNLLALPATMYAMLLMVQAPVQAQRVLGVAVFLLVLGYLWFITALLLFIVRKKTALGLCIAASQAAGGSSLSAGCGKTALAAVPCFTAPGQISAQYSGLQSQPSQGLSTQSSLSMQDSAMLLLSAQPSSTSDVAVAVNTPDLLVIAEDDSAAQLLSMDSASSSYARWWRPGGGLKEVPSWGSTGPAVSSSSSITKHESARTLWVSKSTESSTWQSAGAEADAVDQIEGEQCCMCVAYCFHPMHVYAVP
jgi:hypothetical protein